MANFRAYNGLFVRITKDVPKTDRSDGLKENEILQIINTRWHIAFLGKNGAYPKDGSYMEPIRETK